MQQAQHFTEENKDRVYNFVGSHRARAEFDVLGNPTLEIENPNESVTAVLGDWVMMEENGNFTVLKQDEFDMICASKIGIA